VPHTNVPDPTEKYIYTYLVQSIVRKKCELQSPFGFGLEKPSHVSNRADIDRSLMKLSDDPDMDVIFKDDQQL